MMVSASSWVVVVAAVLVEVGVETHMLATGLDEHFERTKDVGGQMKPSRFVKVASPCCMGCSHNAAIDWSAKGGL